MATIAQNDRGRRTSGQISGLPLDLSVNAGAINSGDLAYWTGAGVASFGSGPLTLNAALVALLAKRLGVSRDTNPLTAGGIVNPIETVGVDTEGVFLLNTTAADTYSRLTEVTIGADAQTITVAPVGPSMSGATASGTGSTWTVGNHTVQACWVTALGDTMPGVSAVVTVASGNNIVTPVVSVPAYAIGVAFFVDGILAGFSATGGATTLAGIPTGSRSVLPIENALSIGRVLIDPTNISPGATAPSTITGAAGVKVQVAITKPFPFATTF